MNKSNSEEIEVKYLIPFDSRYFLMGAALLQNFISLGVKKSDIFTLDYGLDKNQISFIETLGLEVLGIPAYLKGSHPFKVKANLIGFLRERSILNKWLVLLDADMVLLCNPTNDIQAIIKSLAHNNQKLAICQDMGPAKNVKEFLNNYPETTKRFRKLLPEDYLEEPYLNTGFIIFSENFDFYKWQYLASLMEGETIWEQNAMNLLCAEEKSFQIIPAKTWNCHGDTLLNTFDSDNPPFLLHTTGTNNSVLSGDYLIPVENGILKYYYRHPVNVDAKIVHSNSIQRLIDKNRPLLNSLLSRGNDNPTSWHSPNSVDIQ